MFSCADWFVPSFPLFQRLQSDERPTRFASLLLEISYFPGAAAAAAVASSLLLLLCAGRARNLCARHSPEKFSSVARARARSRNEKRRSAHKREKLIRLLAFSAHTHTQFLSLLLSNIDRVLTTQDGRKNRSRARSLDFFISSSSSSQRDSSISSSSSPSKSINNGERLSRYATTANPIVVAATRHTHTEQCTCAMINHLSLLTNENKKKLLSPTHTSWPHC